MEKVLYKMSEVREILGVSRNLIDRLVKEGKIKVIKVGNVNRITAKELDRIINNGVK